MSEEQQNLAVWLITLIGMLCLLISLISNWSASRPKVCDVKGNVSLYSGDKIYHLPSDKYYDSTLIEETRGEKYFCSIQEAEESGWRSTSE